MDFLLPDATWWLEKLGIILSLVLLIGFVVYRLIQRKLDKVLTDHSSAVEQLNIIMEAFKDPNDVKDKKIIPIYKLVDLMRSLNQKCGTENCPVISMVSSNIRQEKEWRAEVLDLNKQTFDMFRQFVSGFGETAMEALLTLSERLRNGQRNQNK